MLTLLIDIEESISVTLRERDRKYQKCESESPASSASCMAENTPTKVCIHSHNNEASIEVANEFQAHIETEVFADQWNIQTEIGDFLASLTIFMYSNNSIIIENTSDYRIGPILCVFTTHPTWRDRKLSFSRLRLWDPVDAVHHLFLHIWRFCIAQPLK